MAILERLLGFEQRGEGFHVSQEPPGWVSKLFGQAAASGVVVNEQTAMTYSAYSTCVRILAETEAWLPLVLYRRRAGRGKDRATDHPLYSVLHNAPNEEMTTLQFRECLTGHMVTWGNAYSEIEWSGGGWVRALWPLRPDRMRVARENGRLVYYYRVPDKVGGEVRRLEAWRVLHVPAFGFDGITGYTPVQLHQEAIGLGMAASEFGARFYANDASPGGVLEHPGKLSDDAYDRLLESWEGRHGGLSGKHRTAILEEGLKWNQVGLPPDTARFLETCTYGLRQMAMIHRIPPHFLADLERATFSNIEHQDIGFVRHTMMPWLVRWEQAIWLKLLSPAERADYFAEHLVDALERGDTQARYSSYNIGRNGGWLSANDIREKENMNPIENGDVYLVPLNMVPADQAGMDTEPSIEGSTSTPDPSPEDGRGEGQRSLPIMGAHTSSWEDLPEETRAARAKNAARERHRLMLTHRRLYRKTLARVLRREANDVAAAARKRIPAAGVADFLLWLDEFYREHAGFIAEQVKPLAFSYGELVVASAHAEVGQRAEPAGVAGGKRAGDDEPALSPELERWVQRYIEAFASRHSTISAETIRRTVREALDAGEDPLEALEALLGEWRDESKRASRAGDDEAARFNNGLARMAYILAGIKLIRWVSFGENCPYCDSLNGRVVGIFKFFVEGGEEFQPDGVERPLQVATSVGHAPLHGGCDCMTMAG